MRGFLHQALATLAATGLLVFSSIYSLKAQSGPAVDADAALWSHIEAQLDQQASDTSFQFILPLVRSHCGRDMDCLFRNYRNTITQLERRFNLPAAIFVCEEIVKIAQAHEAVEEEAQAYLHSCRFQDALGNTRLAAFNIENALRLFEQVGDPRKVMLAKYWKARISLRHRKTEEALPEMEALLSEAQLQNDTGLLVRLHQFLASKNSGIDRYEKKTEHLDALEAILASNPLIENWDRYQLFVFKSRGDIAHAAERWEDAKGLYQRALLLSRSIPDHWIEIKCLQILAELDWTLGNRPSAKSYIEKAHSLAGEQRLDDLLIYSFGVKVSFAEAEGRYAEALKFWKERREIEVRWENRASGSNAQNYFLETENENRKLELALKNTQLRYSLLVALLILLLAAGVFIAYRKQRAGKRKLSKQNALIQQQAEQLKSLDAAKSRFFANVSHELRTPLALMLGPVGTLLKENHLTDKQAQLLQLAHQSGKQLEQLVTDILDLGKLEMGKMELDEKPTELATFFRRCLAQFESLADSRQIDFSFDIAIANDVAANLDQAKCRQILNNLLSNAFKFTPAGGQVNVELKIENLELGAPSPSILHSQFSILPSQFSIQVTDTGPGIHPDDLPHLFDRYFQTTRPDKPAEGGTGIGLALCHEYAQLFGGKIEVESALGKGSEFRVTFPVTLTTLYGETPVLPPMYSETPVSPPMYSETPVSPPMYSETPVSPPMYSETPVSPPANIVGETGVSPYTSTAKPTILVVEDNPDLQAYIRLILEEKYHIITAENGQAALGVMSYELRGMADPTGLQKTHNSSLITPDLILSDLMMPVMDGYQLLEKLKSNDATRHIPTIMLTARAEAQDKLKALRIGVDDYLLKPFDEEELLVRIENLLKNQAARRTAAAEESAAESVAHLEGVPHLSQPENAPHLSQPDREWLETFESYVRQHIADDTLSVSALAYQFAMSESTLLRQLKRLTGLSPLQYLLEVRLSEARRLLENRQYNSIAQVASKVGYGDAQSFSRSFKQRFGKLPSELMEA